MRSERGIYISNLAIQRHGRCCDIQEAFREFHAMSARNDFSWRLLLGACLGQGDDACLGAAMDTFRRMPLADAISGTALLGRLARGRGVTIEQTLAFFDDLPLRDLVSWNCVLGVLELDHAGLVFHRMPQWNLVSMNSLLAAFVERKSELGARDFFAVMPSRNIISWTTMIRCGTDRRALFDRIPARNLVSWNAALTEFARVGDSNLVCGLFDRMPERDLVSWTTLLAALAEESASDLLKIFARMPLHDLVSSTVAISRLPTDEALRILESMPIHDAAPWNAILGSYLRDGDRLSAYRLFDRMPLRNLISWNTLLTASIEEGSSPLERIFHSMPKRNSVSWNALLAAYAQRGQMSQAANVLDLMPERSVVSWTVMILACCACVDSATRMLQSMPAHSLVTWTTMLAVYAHLGHPDRAKVLFHKMPYRDLVCWNTLIAAYGHGGEVDLVPRVFDLMPMRDLIAWSACIAANSCCGRLWDSFRLFWAMELQGIAPNEVVLQCILSCCSHAGDLDAGIHCFRSMIVDHALDLSKEHYSCIVDLLGRAGQLGPARDLLEHMPFVPDVEWTSLTIHHYSSHTWRAGKWNLILPPGQIVLDPAFA